MKLSHKLTLQGSENPMSAVVNTDIIKEVASYDS